MQRPQRRTMLIVGVIAAIGVVVGGALALGAMPGSDEEADLALVVDDPRWPARGDRVDDDALRSSFASAWQTASEGYGWDADAPTDGARLLYAGTFPGQDVGLPSDGDAATAFVVAEHRGRLVTGMLAEPDGAAPGEDAGDWRIRVEGYAELDRERGPLSVGAHVLLPIDAEDVLASEPDDADPEGWAFAAVPMDPDEHDGLLLGIGSGGYVQLDAQGERRTYALGVVEDAAWAPLVDLRLGDAEAGDVLLTEPDGARAAWALRSHMREIANIRPEEASSDERPWAVEPLATGTIAEGMRAIGHRIFDRAQLVAIVAVVDDGSTAAAVHVAAPPSAGDPWLGFAVVEWGDRGPLLVYGATPDVADLTLQSGGETTSLLPASGVVSGAEAPMARPFVLTGTADGIVYPAAEVASEAVLDERELGAP